MLSHSFHAIKIFDESLSRDTFALTIAVLDKKRDPRFTIIDETHIDDRLIQYVFDTFSWIPNLDTNFHGLHYHGSTLFPTSVRDTLKAVISGWISIFSSCPDPVVLREGVCRENGSWWYEYCTMGKEEVLKPFQELLRLTEHMEEKGVFLFHLGI